MNYSRNTLRVLLFQTLYIAEFRGVTDSDALIDIFNETAQNTYEGEPKDEQEDGQGQRYENLTGQNKVYVKNVLQGMLAQQQDIDALLAKVATGWPIEKMAIVDRTILRLGLFEMLFGTSFDVPPKVAINEAIELAKLFGGSSSFSFVNGVLGTILKEVNADGAIKDTTQATEKKAMVGALVFSIKDGVLYFLFVKDMKNKWSVPKGGIEEDEDVHSAVKRVVREEVGLIVDVYGEIGDDMYINHTPDGVVRKEVSYLSAKSPYSPIHLKESEGLKEAGWFTRDEVSRLPMYKSANQIFKDAITGIVKNEMNTGKRKNQWERFAKDLHSVGSDE